MCIRLRLSAVTLKTLMKDTSVAWARPVYQAEYVFAVSGWKHQSCVLHAGPRADGVKCHMVKCHVLLGVFCYCVLGNVRKTHWLVSHYICFSALKKKNTPCLRSLLHLHHFATVTNTIIFSSCLIWPMHHSTGNLPLINTIIATSPQYETAM